MYMKRAWSIHLTMLLAFCWLLALAPSSSGAQTDAIIWNITPGFDRSYKHYTWFPVTITIANTGPDIHGMLSVQLRPGQTSTYSQEIDLPHNAQKQVVLPVFGDNEFGARARARVTLRDGNTLVREETVNLNMLDTSLTVVGVVSDDSSLLPELADLKLTDKNAQTSTPSILLRLSSAMIPDRAELLQTFDALFMEALDTSQWTESQRDALYFWVLNGGHLVVGGDRRIVDDLAGMLPATASADGGISSLRGLGESTHWRLQDEAHPVSLLQLNPKPGAEVVLQGDAGQPLLVRQIVGVGSITVAAFDLQALREVGDAGDFWPRVVPLNRQPPSAWAQLHEQGLWRLQQVLNLPTRNLPSILSMWAFLLLYILAIGPLNYLLLRRLDRREWAYLTIPLLVLLFSGGAYAWGTLMRGQLADFSQLTLARALPNASEGRAMTYLTLFSPSRHAYDLHLACNVLVSDLQRPWERQGRPIEVVDRGTGVAVPDLLVDVGAVRALVIQQTIPVPHLEATLHAAGQEAQITLRNRSSQQITDIVLVRGDGMAQQGMTLAPGEERIMTLDADLAPLDALPLTSSGKINRQAVLQQFGSVLLPGMASGGFVDPMGPMEMPPPPAAVMPEMEKTVPLPRFDSADATHLPDPASTWYVLGWQSRAPVAVTLDGRAASSTGETLYVWTVAKEQ
jgi:hypothetical protein